MHKFCLRWKLWYLEKPPKIQNQHTKMRIIYLLSSTTSNTQGQLCRYLCVNMGTFIQPPPQTLHNTRLKPKDYTCYNNHNPFITIPIFSIWSVPFHFQCFNWLRDISPSMPTASKRIQRHSYRRYLQLHKPFKPLQYILLPHLPLCSY